MKIAERYQRALEWFAQEMPVAETELHFESPYQLLVAVILSAQCTDKRINMITPALFEAFPTPESLAAATEEEVFGYIRSVSYPNNKTKSLLGMARKLVDDFGGKVPSDLDSLLTLPGVGRKTANVILAVVYDQPTMAVDTHVFRVSERIGLTHGSKNPLQTERTLVRHIPPEIVPKAHHWLILHGRYVCKARKPMCGQCGLTEICRYYQANNNIKNEDTR
ncbi:MAG: endonuclease III [Muribaculaceae bacterium]|nr:endonuclease III [Muribaculaceae bacterium]